MAAFRCPDCNKFVSTEIEVTDIQWAGDVPDSIDEEATLTLTFSLSKVCADCGTELATKEIDQEVTFSVDPEALKGDWESSI